jgi:hypothetical protein
MQVSQIPVVLNHCKLTLPASYDVFLNSLGYRTRRNFRYYRRQFEAAGHHHVPELSVSELRDAALYLRTRCRISDSLAAVNRICNWLEALDCPFACGLRSARGEWLSVAAGFRDPSAATLAFQLNNDQEFERDSLSLVLRGYLIDPLIRDGVQELFFWAGVGGALARYVEPLPGTAVHVDSRGYTWSLVRKAVKILAPRFPKKIQKDLDWITPRSANVLRLFHH